MITSDVIEAFKRKRFSKEQGGITCTGLSSEYTLADVGQYLHPASLN